MTNSMPRALASMVILSLFPAGLHHAAGQDTKPDQDAPSDEAAAQDTGVAYVRMSTSLGDIVLELNREKAPITVENFLNYAEKEAYDGTIFHRVIGTFMIQGGGFNADLERLPTDEPIKNEWQNGLENVSGSIAMARLGNRPDSATNQFFINVQDNPVLDQPRDGAGYAVFGKVIGGMDTVEAIRTTPTRMARAKEPEGLPLQNLPDPLIVIESVRKIDAKEAESLKGKSLKRDGDESDS